MKNISTKLKIMGIASILLWIIGSVLLYNIPNGKGIIISCAVIIIAGLYAQLMKERKERSEG